MVIDKLWSGRFSESVDAEAEAFTASHSFDRRLVEQDILGSCAHAKMLLHCGILTKKECDSIISGLKTIWEEVKSNQFPWSNDHEDVHMNVEARLFDLIGVSGKKLHTARSRNDQIATDLRLYVRKAIGEIGQEIIALQTELINVAERENETIIPGLTH